VDLIAECYQLNLAYKLQQTNASAQWLNIKTCLFRN